MKVLLIHGGRGLLGRLAVWRLRLWGELVPRDSPGTLRKLYHQVRSLTETPDGLCPPHHRQVIRVVHIVPAELHLVVPESEDPIHFGPV